MAEYESELPLLIAEAKGLQTEHDALKESIPYHRDEETLRAIAALNTLLNAISVETSGISGKIGTIQDYQAQKRISASVQIHLEDMLVEQSIALKAAQARTKTATRLRDQARRYAIITISLPEMWRSMKRTKESIRNANYFIERVERELGEATPPHVVDNVATLYPVSITSP